MSEVVQKVRSTQNARLTSSARGSDTTTSPGLPGPAAPLSTMGYWSRMSVLRGYGLPSDALSAEHRDRHRHVQCRLGGGCRVEADRSDGFERAKIVGHPALVDGQIDAARE